MSSWGTGPPDRYDPADPEPTGVWPAYPPPESYVPGPGAGITHPYPYLAPHHPQAVTALVLGLLSLVVCPFVGIGAVIVGRTVHRDCDASPGRWAGRGLGTAGLVMGLIALIGAFLWMGLAATLVGLSNG